MIQRTLTIAIGSGNDEIRVAVPLTAEGENNRNVAIAPEAADQEVDFAFSLARAHYLVIVADNALTITSNDASDGSPDDTIELQAGVPIVWTAESGQANPFTVDVTALYATNESTTATATLRIIAGIDATPEGS